VNKTIHARLLDEGVYHLHQFSIPDRGIFKQDEIVYPLRFMCGNPNTTKDDVDGMVEYVRTLGEQVAAQLQ
jgi:L-2,4-diaminobutyrate decarboxylase